jgi:hypothetical protein
MTSRTRVHAGAIDLHSSILKDENSFELLQYFSLYIVLFGMAKIRFLVNSVWKSDGPDRQW